MSLLVLEILLLTGIAFAGGVVAGRVAYAVSSRAAAASLRDAATAPALDPEADIEDIYAMFEPSDEQGGGQVEPDKPEPQPEPAAPSPGRIPGPARPAQVKFERLLKEARESQQRGRDETETSS